MMDHTLRRAWPLPLAALLCAATLALAASPVTAAAPSTAALSATASAAASARSLPAPAPPSAAIASAHPLATAAGMEILRAGGNAFDAAVAVAAALAVVEPTGSGLTGGGFFLLHRAGDGFETAVDAREYAPAGASRDMFLDATGKVVPGLSMESALAAGVPGEPAGMAWLASHYGHLGADRLLAPAIRLARDGFPLGAHLRAALQSHLEQFRGEPDVARNFLRKGEVPPEGTIIRQPELAATLVHLAKHGLGSFYEGELAQRLVAAIRAQGGIWTADDLAAYRVIERAPLVGQYRGARVVSAPPPSSGGVVLLESLNILSQFDLAHASPLERKRLVIEAMRRAHRDRAVWLGDPDFVDVPTARLTSADYAAGLAASVRRDRATPSSSLPGVPGAASGPQTTHFSVMDKEGNLVAATITLNFGFGSGRMLAGTGLFLNNEMDDFSVKPGVPNGYGLVGGEANAIAPHKRMLSSVTPSFVDSGKRLMVGGSPGGSFIPGMVLLATLDFMDGAGAADIVGHPRFHMQYLPDTVLYEPDAFTPAEITALAAQGDTLKLSGRRWGNFQAIVWDRDAGKVEAASDPRVEGGATVE